MTAKERIDAAIAALDLARTDINECDYENIDAVLKAGTTVEDAAYDLVDEVIRLRKWQSEAVEIIKHVVHIPEDGIYDRLIAEAQED